MQLLITGATGKVGVNLIDKLLSEPRWRDARIRALCHNRALPETERIEVVKGSIDDRGCVDRAMRGVTHVVHLGDLQGDSGNRHGRDGEGTLLAAGGLPSEQDGTAIHPDRRRRGGWAFLLRP